MGSTRAERAESTRRKILDTAVRLFLDKPYDEVSVHDLANAAGVSYGLVAHHFGNKKGIHREAIRQIARSLEQHPPPPGPATARIRRLIGDHLGSTRQDPPAYLGLMFGADPESRALIDSGKQIAVHAAAEILDLDPEHPSTRMVLCSWVGAASEATVTWLQDGSRFTVEEMTEWLAATLAEMLRRAAHLDPSLDPALALTALERPEHGRPETTSVDLA